MNIKEIKEKINSDEYNFLRENKHLGKNLSILTVGGSHAYGTNVEGSDLDIRGCAVNTKSEILTGTNFEQFINEKTDTTIYSFNKLIHLLCNVNPNTIEMLGNKPEHYLYVSDIGKLLLDNSHLFLSKKAIYSFGGYANQQLRRLENKANLSVGQEQNEQHILSTIDNAWNDIKEKYFDLPNDAINLYIDKAVNKEMNTEIFIDVTLTHYPLRDYKALWSELNSIVKSYNTIGKRNQNAIVHNKIGKHMMHLVRLYYMCNDILEKEQIITYREKEHDLLMDIRNGKFLDDNNQPISEFYDIVNDLEKRMNYAKENTSLPDKPDIKKIYELVMTVNESIVKDCF